MNTHPRVFISYSHDTPQHSGQVLEFAFALRQHGIDVEFDQFHRDEIVDWPRWCNEQSSKEHSDFVLCVCTAEYRRRIEGKSKPEAGKGVYWEGVLLDDEIYDDKGNRRILPILFGDEPESSIPRFLRGWTVCRVPTFNLTDGGYETLLRILTRQARVTKTQLGSIPVLSSQPTDSPQNGNVRHETDSEQPAELLCDAATAFIGPTQRGPAELRVVRSWEEFVQTFGPPLPISRSFLGYTVRGFFENGGRDAWIGRTLGDSAAVAAATVSTDLSEQQLFVRAQSPGAWGNELRVKIGAGTRGGLRLEVFDTPDSPERADPAVDEQPAEDFDNLAYESDWEQFIEKVNRRSTRVTLSWLRADLSASKPLFGQVVLAGGADGYFMNVSGYLAATDDASHPFALRALDDLSETAILCVPDSVHPDMPPADRQQIEQAAVSHCERHSRIVLLTTAAGEHSLERLRPLVDSASAVIYYPWLRVAHTNASDEIVIPPVGHVAGLLARNDFERGVHIQPSGLPLLGTVSGGGKGAGGLDRQASSADQRLIPRLGINPIHTDPSTDQPCVSTALTTAVPEELHALNRQRFNNYIIRSLRLGLMWTYFEPNDEDVAQRVKEQVSLFFERLLQRGALSGKDPKEAFWVDVERRDDHLLLAFGMAASVESVPGTWRNIALSLPLDQ